jgi:uncharacterized protein DUF4255
MNAEAIQRVSTTIALLIEGALSSVEGVTSKVFIGPPSDPASKQAQLVLFPYRLAANSALHAEQVSPPVGQVIPPARPVVLDIWYLLSIGTMSVAAVESQVWLGRAMQALQQASVLTGPAVDGDQVRLTLEAVTTEELAHVWALFPNTNYRTSVVYVASPVRIDK